MDYEQEVFVEKLNEKMNKKSEEFGFTIQSGVPFEMVIADEIREFESGAWDADETDNSVGDWGKSKDLECDLWFENEEIQTIKIVQAKHSKSYESDTSPDDLKRFFTTWRRLLDPDVVENEANENLQNRLNGFEEKINDGWTVEFQFITTKKVSLNREGKVRKYELEAHKDGYENFSFTTMGLVDFHEYCDALSKLDRGNANTRKRCTHIHFEVMGLFRIELHGISRFIRSQPRINMRV